jgi:mono/diheme cytochrome c family protein
MRTPILCFSVVSALWLVPAGAQPSAQPIAQPSADVERGHALFVSVGCSQCHGTVGQGSRSTGPRLAPQPIAFESFLHVLRHPINDMPPYVSQVLSDGDAHDIHAYLQSIPAPTRQPGDIPALNR